MAAKDQATSPAPSYEEDDGGQPAAQRKWGATEATKATPTDATATGTQTAPLDEVVVGSALRGDPSPNRTIKASLCPVFLF